VAERSECETSPARRATGWCASSDAAQARWSPGGGRRWSCCRLRARMCRPIAQVTFTSQDRVRDVLYNANLDGFNSL
jgi:hypothetical protein